MLKFLIWSGAKECRSSRSRKMWQNDALDAKIGVDTAENEPNMFMTYAMGISIIYLQASSGFWHEPRFDLVEL